MTSPLTTLFSSLLLLLAVADGWLGVYTDPNSEAPRVVECVPGSPAEKAGLAVGDVILAIDDTIVANTAELTKAVRARSPGDQVALRIRREGKEVTVAVVLGERPAQGGVPAEPAAPREPGKRPGAPSPVPAPESRPAGRPRLGLSLVEERGSLRVARVEERSTAQRAGFREGDVIVKAGDATVDSHAALQDVVARGGAIAFAVRRGDETIELRVELPTGRSTPDRRDPREPREPRGRREPREPRPDAQPDAPRPTMPLLEDYDAALEAAEKAGLAVFVIYGANDDGMTQAQKRAFLQGRVQDALAGYVAVYVDREANAELHAARKVATTPTLEIRRGSRTTWRHEGYLAPAALRAALRGEAPEGDRADAPAPAAEDPAGDSASELERLRAEVRALQEELERLRRRSGSSGR